MRSTEILHGNNTDRIDLLKEGILQLDLSGKILFINKKLLKMSGYREDELIGKSSFGFLDQSGRTLLESILKERKDGRSGSHVISLKAKDGVYKEFIVSGTPILNKNSAVVGTIATFFDVTESSYLKNYLTKESGAGSELLRVFNLAFWIYDISKKRIDYLSPGFAELYEVSLDKVYSLNSIKEFIHEDDYERVIVGNKKNLSNGKFSIQYRIRTPKGNIKWVTDDVIIVKGKNGKAEQLIGLTYDITEQKRIEKKLIDGERENEIILKKLSDSFCLINSNTLVHRAYLKSRDKNILRSNIRFAEGKLLEKVFCKEISQQFNSHFEQLKNGNVSNIVFKCALKHERGEICYEIKLSKINSDLFLMQLTDVTQVESNINRIQKLFNITEHTKETVIITDSNHIIEYVNPEFVKRSGYDLSELLRQSLETLGIEKLMKGDLKKVNELIRTGQIYQGKYLSSRKDGTVLEEEKTIVPILSFEGKITNYLYTGRTCSNKYNRSLHKQQTGAKQKRLLEKSLSAIIQKEELERKRIASKLHENLAQMLSATLMNLESFGYENYLDEKGLIHFESVNDTIGKLISEVRQLSGDIAPLSLHQFGLQQTVNQYVRSFQTKNNSINYIFSSNFTNLKLSKEIQINLFRILQEALLNVQKHAKAKECLVKLNEDEKKNLELIIKDDGVGMDKKRLAKLKNDGLGLRVMKERVRSMNGKLMIRTEPGIGFELRVKIKIK